MSLAAFDGTMSSHAPPAPAALAPRDSGPGVPGTFECRRPPTDGPVRSDSGENKPFLCTSSIAHLCASDCHMIYLFKVLHWHFVARTCGRLGPTGDFVIFRDRSDSKIELRTYDSDWVFREQSEIGEM